MKVYLVRHGQTNYNLAELHNDDPAIDVHLTRLGKQQSRAVAEKLRGAPIQHVFISELKRTRQTADIINLYHSAPISIDARLNDNKSGFEGQPDIVHYNALSKAKNKWTVRFNDGESLKDVKQRVQSFIQDLKRTKYDACLVVTSRVLAQDFYGIVKGLTDEQAWEFHIDKGGCIELEL